MRTCQDQRHIRILFFRSSGFVTLVHPVGKLPYIEKNKMKIFAFAFFIIDLAVFLYLTPL
jgi:hypothetical protein